MKKHTSISIVCITLFLCSVCLIAIYTLALPEKTDHDFGKNGYVKSATYFGDEWPINFWNSEMDYLDDDLEQIKRDGFDSIIIVIPWKEFQTSVNPIGYSDYAFLKLSEVMEAADSHGLNVYARISYTWDYYNDLNEDNTTRIVNIFLDERTREGWIEYCQTMYEVLSQHDNFKGGFLTWEDFWCCLEICNYDDENIRTEYADIMGYQQWIQDNYTIEEYNEKFGLKYKDYNDIAIPLKTEPAMEAMYMFFDNCLNDILSEAQAVFPNMSMEVRLDEDLIYTLNGGIKSYSHAGTYECQDSNYTAVMYGIPMGFENHGEKVTAQEAVSHTESILSSLLNKNGGKPIYVEQFLYIDNTPAFSYNAQIKEEDIDTYLVEVGSVLEQYTGGYGIWTYRDYRNNMLYNAQFALGARGWIQTGAPKYVLNEYTDSTVCELTKGDSLEQTIPNVRNHFDSEEYIVVFDIVDIEEKGVISILVGDQSEKLEISNTGKYQAVFPKNASFDLKITADSGRYQIDNLCMYSFVQNGHLYDVNNEELEYIESIRKLNQKLKDATNKYYNNEDSLETSADSIETVHDWLARARFENNVDTADNPWNTTAGIIEMDGDESVFLTPGTAIVISDIGDNKEIKFSYMIHPWVKKDSDGAGLILTLLDAEQNVLTQKEIEVNKDSTWTEYCFDMSEYNKISSLRIACNDGNNNDAICDWVVLQFNVD